MLLNNTAALVPTMAVQPARAGSPVASPRPLSPYQTILAGAPVQLHIHAPVVEYSQRQGSAQITAVRQPAATPEMPASSAAADGAERDNALATLPHSHGSLSAPCAANEAGSAEGMATPSVNPVRPPDSEDEKVKTPNPAESRGSWSSPQSAYGVTFCIADPPASAAQQPSSPAGGQRTTGGGRTGSSSQLAASPSQEARRLGETCHDELYEDAILRKHRLRLIQETVEHAHEIKEQMRLEQHAEDMRQWRRLYHTKDSRSHLEREREHIRKKRENQAKHRSFQNQREQDKLRECTFRPDLSKGRRGMASGAATTGSGGHGHAGPGGGGGGAGYGRPQGPAASSGNCQAAGGCQQDAVAVELRRLVAKQHSAAGRLRALTSEEVQLRDRLRALRADLHESIQREETRQVVAMLQANSSGGDQQELVQRVRSMVAAGSHPEAAQRQIVGELVAQSQDEVRRRVGEAFSPLQQEAETSLNNRRFAILQELEGIESDAAALLLICGNEEAMRLGFEPDLASRSRSDLLRPLGAGSSLVLVPASAAGPMTPKRGSGLPSPPKLGTRSRSAGPQ